MGNIYRSILDWPPESISNRFDSHKTNRFRPGPDSVNWHDLNRNQAQKNRHGCHKTNPYKQGRAWSQHQEKNYRVDVLIIFKKQEAPPGLKSQLSQQHGSRVILNSGSRYFKMGFEDEKLWAWTRKTTLINHRWEGLGYSVLCRIIKWTSWPFQSNKIKNHTIGHDNKELLCYVGQLFLYRKWILANSNFKFW